MRFIRVYLSLLLVCLLLGITGCTNSSIEHWIDNPTDKEITLNIDGTDITIPAKSGINYKFEYGKHTLTYNGSSVNFMVKPSTVIGFINPTQSNYIFYKHIYVNKNDERATESYIDWLQQQTNSETSIIINDSLQTLPLPFKVVNDLFIEKANYNWDYYLDETIPTNVILQKAVITKRNRSLASDPNYQAGAFQTVKSKIFREADFINYLKDSGVKDNIAFPQNIKPLAELPKIKMVKIALNNIACPVGRQKVESVLEHWEKWLTMSGADFAKEYNNYILYVGLKALPSSLEQECYQKYNKDYTYKTARSQILGVQAKIYYANFFITE